MRLPGKPRDEMAPEDMVNLILGMIGYSYSESLGGFLEMRRTVTSFVHTSCISRAVK